MNKSNINIHERIRPFPYLSDLFKHIEGFNMMGHQIGRKVGDMLELVVMAKVHSNPELAKRVIYEPKMIGATGAGHKVEFGFYENTGQFNINKPFGFIECKKVGVEVTKDTTTRNSLRNLSLNQNINIVLRRKWLKTPVHFDLRIIALSKDRVNVEIKITGQKPCKIDIFQGGSIKLVVTEDGRLHLLGPTENLREISGIVRVCKYINLEKISDDQCSWSLYDCLTGPQTIEKAKQASLVAMDIRKLVDGRWGKDDINNSEKTITSILVITEASHWEEKSRKVITTCIDHNIIIPDEIIVEAFRMFEEAFTIEKMFGLIRKSEYLQNKEVRDVLSVLLAKFENKLFYDLNLNTYVDFYYQAGKLQVRGLSTS